MVNVGTQYTDNIGGGTITLGTPTTITMTVYTSDNVTDNIQDVVQTVDPANSEVDNLIEITDEYLYADLVSGETFQFEANST